MNRYGIAAALCAASFLVCGAAAFPQAPEGPMAPRPGTTIQPTPPEALAKITARVTLVNLPVTVRDASGAMIHDLEQQDFVVTDNGVPQKITHFDVGTDPISLVVVVETSDRMDSFLPQLRKTGILFTEQVMGPDAEAAVIGFDDEIHKLQDFTRSHDAVQSAFAAMRTGDSGQHLFDAMAAGIEMLSGRGKPAQESSAPGRRVLLVMAEALDKGSEYRLGEVLRRAQLENVTIFSVGLSTTRSELNAGPRQNAPGPMTPPGTSGAPMPPGIVRSPTSEGNLQNAGVDLMEVVQVLVEHVKSAQTKHALELGAVATGGAYYSSFKGRSIQEAIDEIGGELHSQYMISYSPAHKTDEEQDAGYHRISVSLVEQKAKDRRITSRPGYYVGPPGS